MDCHGTYFILRRGFWVGKSCILIVSAVGVNEAGPFVACGFPLTLGQLMASRETSCGIVLVVDDDVVIHELLRVVLDVEGYEVLLAGSCDEALALLAREGAAIDVVLMDLHIPGVKSAELARLLNAGRARETLLIGMSGSRLPPAEAELFGAFLQKPFSGEDFTEAVKRARAGGVGATENPETEDAGGRPVLDEEIYRRLAAMLPAAQLRELYRITVDDVRRRVDLMRAAQERGDMQAYRSEAHAIKGGCGMVGASELSSLAAAAERSTEGSSKSDNPALADFDDACTRLQVMLDGRI
jgi:CheY-like chemotaxis protein